MRVVSLVLLVLLVLLAGCTSDADVDTAASSPAETTATEVETAPATPREDATAAATEAPGDTSGSPEPSGAASPDLSQLDQVVEELGVPPQTVLGVSFAACAALAEGLDRGQVEQRLRDMEAELSLQELSADQLSDIVDAGVESLCPDRA